VPSADCTIGCFGKLPIAGDFVRGANGLPEFEQLDAWIQDGLHRSQALLGTTWQSRFDSLQQQHFLFAPDRSGTRIVGRFQPSRDAAGRRYPFVVAGKFSSIPNGMDSLLPLALAAFLTDAADLADSGFDGHTVLSAIAAVHSLTCVADMPGAEQSFVRDSHKTTPEMLLRAADQDASLLLQQLAGFAIAPPRYCLRWESRSEPSDLAFWIQLLAGFQGNSGSLNGPCMWMWPAHGRGHIRLALGPLEARIFPGMLFSDYDDDHAYDLGRDHGDVAAAQAARARFADSLSMPDLAGVLAAATGEGAR